MNYNTKESLKSLCRSITEIARFEVGEKGDEPNPKSVSWCQLAINAEIAFRNLDADETIEQ